MKFRPLLLIITVFTTANALAQEKIWTKQTKLSEVISFEKEMNNNPKVLIQNVSLSKSYYPLLDQYKVANPFIIQRDPVGYLPIYAQYYFTPEDSILRFVSYDWEIDKFGNFFGKQKIWEKESEKFDTYNSEYERVKNILIKQLGTPTSTDLKAKTVKSDRGKYFTRETIWETEEMYTELNMIFESMTYRIRFNIYWKK